MNDTGSTDFGALHQWVGRTETAQDVITSRLVRELNAALDSASGVPSPLIHWCLAPAAALASRVGRDGHPERGGFLPPVPLPRRMWAGSQMTFHDQLRLGDTVERHSTIGGVTVKKGRTGPLCFVTVDHVLYSQRGLAVNERQDIVYRVLSAAPDTAPKDRQELPVAQWSREMRADPVLLFRYSALTFNGHRIHYDRDYAKNEEFYPGLIVQGPLLATLLMEFAVGIKGSAPAAFRFKAVRPLFDFSVFKLCASALENGLELWIESEGGVPSMLAGASW